MQAPVTPAIDESLFVEEDVVDATKKFNDKPPPATQIMHKLEKNRRGSLEEFMRMSMSVTSGTRRTSLFEESNKPSNFSSFTRGQLLGLIMGPVLCIALCFVPISSEYPKAQLMVGMTAWIVTWWMCMVIPLGMTALLPIVMFPLLEISTAKAVTSAYFNSISWLFIGAFIVDFGIERVELHKRIALKIILKMGTSPKMLMLSMMLVCAILSMFCSNTSTTLMMLPFALGVLEKAEEEVIEEGRPEDVAKVREYGKGLLIGLAWAASIGGSATLIGTTGPAILANYYFENYPYAEVPVNFATWTAFAVGISAVMFIIAYCMMVVGYCHSRAMNDMNKDNMRREYNSLGKFNRDELVVAAAQIFQIIFWFLNGIVFAPFIGECTGGEASNQQACYNAGGTWHTRFTSFDSGIACAAALALFLVPSKERTGERILDWEFVSGRMPWDVLFLLGGGFAISMGFTDSGLSTVIAEALAGLQGISLAAIIYVITLVVIFLTELTSNTATASLMVPIIASAAEAIGVNPLALLLPGTYATGMAFMLPIATPPNAIAYATKRLEFFSMVKGGFVLNIFASLVILLWTVTVGKQLFGNGTWEA